MASGRRKRRAAFLAVLSGSILMAGHFSSVNRWEDVLGVMGDFVGTGALVRVGFWVLLALASLGGLAVILGGLLILNDRLLLAKTLILLGTGFGLISFLLILALVVYRGNLPVTGNSLILLAALGLSIVARIEARG